MYFSINPYFTSIMDFFIICYCNQSVCIIILLIIIIFKIWIFFCPIIGTIFPKISNQKLNSYLKEVADICLIRKNINFQLARHTFSTTVSLTNDVPIETVSKLLCHSRISTNQIYAKVI